jgi:hypothetical protein
MAEEHPDKLRELASWYREFAERAGNPTIWESRLRTAEDLDAAAERIERDLAAKPRVMESRLLANAQSGDLEH